MGWFQKLVYGVDLDEEQRVQDETDAKLAALNKAKLERGVYDDDTFMVAEAQRQASVINVEDEVSTAFAEGFSGGASNIRGLLGGTINTVVGSALSILPWQLWLIGLGWAFVTFAPSAIKSIKRLLR